MCTRLASISQSAADFSWKPGAFFSLSVGFTVGQTVVLIKMAANCLPAKVKKKKKKKIYKSGDKEIAKEK